MCNCNRPVCHECQSKPTPHKHAAVIKAWAEGIPTQFRYPVGGNARWSSWIEVNVGTPGWLLNWEYRVKPTPKPLEDVAHDAFYASCDKEFGGHHWRAVADAVVAAYKERGGS